MKSSPSSHVDHLGSLIRPKLLFDQRVLLEQGKCSRGDLTPIEDAAVAHVVRLQRSLGLATITDGEMRREIFYEGVFDKLDGVTCRLRPMSEFMNYWPHIQAFSAMGLTELTSCFCSGKIRRNKPIMTEEFETLKRLVPRKEVGRLKITMCPPTWFHTLHGTHLTYDKSVYDSDEEYFADVGTVYRAEFKALYALGCRNIQLDEPTFTSFCNDEVLRNIQTAGINPDSLLDLYIHAINLCTRDRPRDLNVAIHLCRGNFAGGLPFTSGSYENIAKKLFLNLDVDTFYLEYDDERSGSFLPLRFVPPTKKVVLGIVTTKHAELENPDFLKARIVEAVQILVNGAPPRAPEVALAQLSISPQCGFASSWKGNPVTEQDVRAKIGLLHQVALDVWGASEQVAQMARL
ncbi:Methionine vitamin-b12 [Mycena indigotica]|uniref:Methionine vitamin-b12 n=1 Tax=Mycena indigotica TaxID=2126181 RepID=A0A8H6SPS5_9AGAR|nr:Methionine vitamin-b12 [Mycena indigotica]KAF7303598.1 Methionine vitamin-b12 [Mycena indigotica]